MAHDPAPKRLRFGRDRRLLRRSDFLRVYREGRKSEGRLTTLFCAPRPATEGVGAPRVGITATRKSGGSVVRNRQRRLVRTFFRLNQTWLPEGWDFVINTKAALATVAQAELGRELTRLLARLGFAAADRDP